MTVGDILKYVGIMISRIDVCDYFGEQNNNGEETYFDILTLLKIINLVVSELSSTYLPLTTEQNVTFDDGKFAYSDLEKKVVKILDVHDGMGNKISYTETAEYIELDSTYSSTSALTVVYQFAPEEYNEESEIDYDEKDIPARVIAYGVAAEYCISQSRFDEATFHYDRYISAIQELKGVKNRKIKARSWK